jgi:hypothetical protein
LLDVTQSRVGGAFGDLGVFGGYILSFNPNPAFEVNFPG